MRHNKFGLTIIAIALLAPIYSFVILAKTYPNLPIVGQYFGVASLIAMALTQLIATRARGLQLIFGPLDKAYVLHKWLGIIAVATVLLHNSIDAEIKGLVEGPLADLGENLGEIGMNGVLVLVGVSFALFIPYHWWRLSHKFIGAFFVLSALHYFVITKPFANTDPLGLYVGGLCVIGMISYVITLLPKRFMRSTRYTVTDVTATGDASAITLAPVKKPIRHRAGQFAFFSFEQKDFDEPHPFTISSAPNDAGTLRITVKGLGRYTRNLGKKLTVGTTARIQGPFGHFGASQTRANQAWIAAGVGITPFMALLDKWNVEKSALDIFYAYRGDENAAHLDELKSSSDARGATLHLFNSANGSRLTASDVQPVVGAKTKLLYCGPKSLRKTLFAELGVKHRNFHYEEFEIRSDIWPLNYVNGFVPGFFAKTRLGKLLG